MEMVEKRFIVADRWIKDNCMGGLLNIDFNTITDANLCCNLLNQIEKEKRDNGKLATQLLKENEQLKQVANDFAENPTQHNLWKLRTVVLKDSDVE